ncbi:hypothetical protein ACOME3_001737 [Neoechinorhynchus agilis]
MVIQNQQSPFIGPNGISRYRLLSGDRYPVNENIKATEPVVQIPEMSEQELLDSITYQKSPMETVVLDPIDSRGHYGRRSIVDYANDDNRFANEPISMKSLEVRQFATRMPEVNSIHRGFDQLEEQRDRVYKDNIHLFGSGNGEQYIKGDHRIEDYDDRMNVLSDEFERHPISERSFNDGLLEHERLVDRNAHQYPMKSLNERQTVLFKKANDKYMDPLRYQVERKDEHISRMIENDRIGVPIGFFESSPDGLNFNLGGLKKRSNSTGLIQTLDMKAENRLPTETITKYCIDYTPSIYTAPPVYMDESSRYHFITCRGNNRPVRVKCPAHRIFSELRGICVPDRQQCNCMNEGQCVLSPMGTMECICKPGYGGLRCESLIDPCSTSICSPGMCLNTTNEQKYICQCKNFIFADSCNEDIPNLCQEILPRRLYAIESRPKAFVYCTDTGLAFLKECPLKSFFDENREVCVEDSSSETQSSEFVSNQYKLPIDATKSSPEVLPRRTQVPTEIESNLYGNDSPLPREPEATDTFTFPQSEQADLQKENVVRSPWFNAGPSQNYYIPPSSRAPMYRPPVSTGRYPPTYFPSLRRMDV